jgi:GT2 family glycosyltransferase
VVDDASRDGTVQAVRDGFPGVQLRVHQHGRGFSAAANHGLREALGRGEHDLFLVLNDDTRVYPGALAALCQSFDDDPRLGIGGANLRFPDGTAQWSGGSQPNLRWLLALASGIPRLLETLPMYRQHYPVVPRSKDDLPLRMDWVTGAALTARRQVLEEVGLFDEGFAFYCQDLDLCLRAGRQGWRVCLLPRVVVMHHQGATIGRSKAAVEQRQRPDLLWPDLLRWARRDRGRTWAACGRGLLALGAVARMAARWASSPFVTPETRRRWHAEHHAVLLALRASWGHGGSTGTVLPR